MVEALKRWIRRTTLLERVAAHTRAVRLRGRLPEGRVSDAPKRVIVEPTNACNLACDYCGNKAMMRPATYLSLDLYRRLIAEMVELGIPRITLHTIGEPTLHSELGEMIALAKEAGRVVNVSTNGTLLTEERARALVAAGPDMLNVSADAGDPETFAITRGGADLEVVLAGMERVRRLREEVGRVQLTPWGEVRLPTLTVTCVVTSLFTREVERRFFETFGPLVDDFYFHFPNNHAEYAHFEPFYHGGLLPKSWRDRLYRALRSPCYYPWDALFLLSDGTMSVCRFDFDARVKVGRFGPQSIRELWHSEAMASLRRAHMSFDFREWPQCDNCTATWYENRAEHVHVSERYKARNGFRPRRNAWLGENPAGIAMGAGAQREKISAV
ncbi:MAG: radical SAM protein [Planctomycetota bacterium]|jgi:hypothetical protein|nr:radical SAM protein [Planctomycetota bacterium]